MAYMNGLKEQGFYHWPTWRRLRKLALQRDNYICQMREKDCTKIATTVHHIKPIEFYPELALELSNLMSVCWNCHELTKPKKPLGSYEARIIKA